MPEFIVSRTVEIKLVAPTKREADNLAQDMLRNTLSQLPAGYHGSMPRIDTSRRVSETLESRITEHSVTTTGYGICSGCGMRRKLESAGVVVPHDREVLRVPTGKPCRGGGSAPLRALGANERATGNAGVFLEWIDALK